MAYRVAFGTRGTNGPTDTLQNEGEQVFRENGVEEESHITMTKARAETETGAATSNDQGYSAQLHQL